MIPTHSDFETALLRAVDEVLYYVWDPIGINDDPTVRDEYYDYVPRVFEILCADSPTETIFREITGYLTHVEVNDISIGGKKEETADRLISMKTHLQARESEGFRLGPAGAAY